MSGPSNCCPFDEMNAQAPSSRSAAAAASDDRFLTVGVRTAVTVGATELDRAATYRPTASRLVNTRLPTRTCSRRTTRPSGVRLPRVHHRYTVAGLIRVAPRVPGNWAATFGNGMRSSVSRSATFDMMPSVHGVCEHDKYVPRSIPWHGE